MEWEVAKVVIWNVIEALGGGLLAGGIVTLAARGLARGWFAFQLERFKSDQARDLKKFELDQARGLEDVKAQLSLLARLHATAEEKQAEIAAEVLIGCLQFLDGLVAITIPAYIQSATDTKKFVDVVNERWQANDDARKLFARCFGLAEAFLSDEVATLMDRIWKQRTEIWSNQSTHFDAVAQGGPRDPELWRAGFGDVPGRVLSALRNEAKALLRPIAQHLRIRGETLLTR